MSVICIACSKQFKKNDEVHSTNCGHIYHFNCVQKWKSRSKCCPACNFFKPFTHRIFLVFDEGVGESVEEVCLQDAKTDLGNVNAQIELLQKRIKENDDKFLSLQHELNKHEDLIKTLRKSLEDMKLQNEKDKKQSAKSESTFKENNKKSSIQQSSKAENVQKNGKAAQSSISVIVKKNENKKPTAQQSHNSINASKNDGTKVALIPSVFLSKYDSEDEEEIDVNTNSILIDAYFDNEARMKDFIINLSRLMNIDFDLDDIHKVVFVDENRKAIVTFMDESQKIEFLCGKYSLREIHSKLYIDLFICDYSHEDALKLFPHAKALKKIGYKTVYYEGNEVFAKQEDDDKPIRIFCKEQVDEMIEDSKTYVDRLANAMGNGY